MPTKITSSNISYSPILQTRKISQYEITVEFEHGDSDATTKDTVILAKCSEPEFIEWYNTYMELEELINDSLDSGEYIDDLRGDYPHLLSKHGYYVPHERDCFDNSRIGVYAKMEIVNIYFYDADGNKRKVNIK
jgi:hypothetical protein